MKFHTIAGVEHRLAKLNVSVAELCRVADVNQSMWHRWKFDGIQPHRSSWNRIVKALPLLKQRRVA